MEIDVRAAGSRFETRTDWVVSRHSFSFGPHYDPANTRFGPLIAHNDEVLQPAGGFPEHPHRAVDIVTWVVQGALRHTDDAGGSGVVRPGVAQRLSAGSGVRHSELNAADGPTRYVQMWVMTDDDEPPDYALADVPGLDGGGLVPVASGRDGAPLRLRRAGADLFAARLPAGTELAIPAAPLTHLFVVSGSVLLENVPLLEGDAARVIEATSLTVVAPLAASGARVDADADAEVLAWSFADE